MRSSNQIAYEEHRKWLETGHAKNVATFEDLISFCTGYGATYNPSKAALKLPALTTQNTWAIIHYRVKFKFRTPEAQ
jgi:hypothetical protein